MTTNPSTFPTLRDIDGLAVIGRTRHDLMGIRYEGEEGGNVPPVPPEPPASDPKPPWGDDPTKFDPDKAWKLIQNTRGDLAELKSKTDAAIAAATEKAAKDALAQFARLLAGNEEPETDPVKLAAKVTDLSSQVAAKDTDLTKAQADIKAGQLSTQVAILAHGLGASPKLLLTNEAFKTSIASVEPTDEAAITAAITAALQANAALKATPSSSGGGEHQGGQIPALDAQLAAAEKANDYPLVISLKRQIAAQLRPTS
jgi:hypothetical protein